MHAWVCTRFFLTRATRGWRNCKNDEHFSSRVFHSATLLREASNDSDGRRHCDGCNHLHPWQRYCRDAICARWVLCARQFSVAAINGESAGRCWACGGVLLVQTRSSAQAPERNQWFDGRCKVRQGVRSAGCPLRTCAPSDLRPWAFFSSILYIYIYTYIYIYVYI